MTGTATFFPSGDGSGAPTRGSDQSTSGVIGFAPFLAFDFPGVHDNYEEFVGAEKLKSMQPLRFALDLGLAVGTGTDYPSLPVISFVLMEGMVHRRNPWVPADESVANNASEGASVAEAIHVYTLGGAHALLKEDLPKPKMTQLRHNLKE